MLRKNDIIKLNIGSVTLQGSGVGRHEGLAVFVPMTAAGDEIEAHILKVKSNCALLRHSRRLSEPTIFSHGMSSPPILFITSLQNCSFISSSAS